MSPIDPAVFGWLVWLGFWLWVGWLAISQYRQDRAATKRVARIREAIANDKKLGKDRLPFVEGPKAAGLVQR